MGNIIINNYNTNIINNIYNLPASIQLEFMFTSNGLRYITLQGPFSGNLKKAS